MPPSIHYSCYQEVRGGNAFWGPRRIDDFEMILCLRGQFGFVNHETQEWVEHCPNEVLTIYPGELHTYWKEASPDTAFYACVHFDPRLGAGEGLVQGRPPRVRRFTPEDAVHELFRRLDRLFHRPTRGAPWEMEYLARTVWTALFDPAPGTAYSDRLGEMLAWLDAELLRHPTRADLAERFHLTPQRVNAIFKEGMAMSPGDYVRRELAIRAHALLHDEGRSVKETARELGFDSQFYFSRVFKQVFGYPPSSLVPDPGLKPAEVRRK